MQWRVPVAILADAVILVAGFYEEFLVCNGLSAFPAVSIEKRRDGKCGLGHTDSDFEQAQLGGQMEGCVAVVVEIGVL